MGSPRTVDLREILNAIFYRVDNGCKWRALPHDFCTAWVNHNSLTLILKPIQAVTNQIWLVYRKSERQSQAVTLLLSWLGIKK
jgi:transposase